MLGDAADPVFSQPRHRRVFYDFITARGLPGLVDFSGRTRWWHDAMELMAVQWVRIECKRAKAMLEKPGL